MSNQTTKTNAPKLELPVTREFADALLDNLYETWDRIRDTTDIPEDVKDLIDSMRNMAFYVFQESTTPQHLQSASSREAVYEDVGKAIGVMTRLNQGICISPDSTAIPMESLFVEVN